MAHVWLEAAGNEELVELINEHNRLIDAFNKLNVEILSVEIPHDPGQETVEATAALREKAEALQLEMVAFESRAKQFIVRPSLDVASDEPWDKTAALKLHLQSHMVQVVLVFRADITNSRLLLANNLWMVVQQAETKRSVKLATDANFMAALSIIMGLFAIFLTVALANQ